MTVAEIIAAAFVAALGVVLLDLLIYSNVAGDDATSEQEKKQPHDEPCETCVRWSECNGVDEQCPRRKGNGENEQD